MWLSVLSIIMTTSLNKECAKPKRFDWLLSEAPTRIRWVNRHLLLLPYTRSKVLEQYMWTCLCIISLLSPDSFSSVHVACFAILLWTLQYGQDGCSYGHRDLRHTPIGCSVLSSIVNMYYSTHILRTSGQCNGDRGTLSWSPLRSKGPVAMLQWYHAR